MHLRRSSLSSPAGSGPASPERRAALGLLAAAAGGLLAACSGRNYGPEPSPAGSQASAPVPVDGVSLAELGIANGPARAWSVPRSSVLTQRIDQPNQVTLQLSHPDPASIVSYLQRALPPAGITIVTAQVQGDTSALIGDGHGWRGSVVGAGASLTLLTLQQQAG